MKTSRSQESPGVGQTATSRSAGSLPGSRTLPWTTKRSRPCRWQNTSSSPISAISRSRSRASYGVMTILISYAAVIATGGQFGTVWEFESASSSSSCGSLETQGPHIDGHAATIDHQDLCGDETGVVAGQPSRRRGADAGATPGDDHGAVGKTWLR